MPLEKLFLLSSSPTSSSPRNFWLQIAFVVQLRLRMLGKILWWTEGALPGSTTTSTDGLTDIVVVVCPRIVEFCEKRVRLIWHPDRYPECISTGKHKLCSMYSAQWFTTYSFRARMLILAIFKFCFFVWAIKTIASENIVFVIEILEANLMALLWFVCPPTCFHWIYVKIICWNSHELRIQRNNDT